LRLSLSLLSSAELEAANRNRLARKALSPFTAIIATPVSAPWLALAALGLALRPDTAHADETLQYDARGNIQGRSVDGAASTYRYDRIDRLVQETGTASQSFGLDANANRTSDGAASYTVLANGNRLVTRSGATLTYDPAGNLLSDQTTLAGTTVTRTFSYNLAGQLRTVSINGSLRVSPTAI